MSNASKKSSGSRRKARELALKGLYQRMLNASEVRDLRRNLADDPDFKQVDEAYLQHLIEGVVNHQQALDEQMAQFLDRSLSELSPIEHAILYIAGFELVHDLSIPYRVAINEGVELAKIYGGIDGHKYVNGVLDKLAAHVRPREFRVTTDIKSNINKQ